MERRTENKRKLQKKKKQIKTDSHFSSVPLQLRVRLGEWNAAGDTEPLPAQEYVVLKIFVHPNFNAVNLVSDVAILRLSTPVPLGTFPTITTACLPVSSSVGSR